MDDFLLRTAPRLRRTILLVLVFGLPTLFLRNLADPINVPKVGLLFLGLSIVAGLRVAEVAVGRSFAALRPLLLPASALLAPLVAATLFSPYRGWALMGDYPRYLGLLPYVASVLLGVLIADAFRSDVIPVMWAFVAAAVMVGGYAFIQMIGLDPFTWGARGEILETTSSTLGNPNFVGGFLGIALPVAVALLFEDGTRRLLAAVAVLNILAGLVAANSAGGFAAAAAGIAVLAGYEASRRWPRAQTAGLVAGLIVTTGVAGSVMFAMVRPDSVPETVERRAIWWGAAGRMTASSPFVGRGPNAFALEHSLFRNERDVEESGNVVEPDPHSVPLALAAGAGVPGLLGFVTAVALVVYRGMRGPRSRIGVAAVAACLGYLAQALVSIDTVALRSSFWILAGCVGAGAVADRSEGKAAKPGHAKGPPGRRKAKPGRGRQTTAPFETRRFLVIFPLVLVPLLVWRSALMLTANAKFNQALGASGEASFEVIDQSYADAIDADDEPAYRWSYADFLGNLALRLQEQGVDDSSRLLDDAEDQFSFVEGAPYVGAMTTHARLIRDWSGIAEERRQESLDLYERAISLDPSNYVLMNEAGSAALQFEMWSEAESMFGRALEIEVSAEPLGKWSLALAHLDDPRAQAAVRRALELDPDEPSAIEAQSLLD